MRTSDAFLAPRNLTAIAGQAGTLLIACLGASFVMVMGSIDLSVGAVALLAGAVSVLVLNDFPIGAGAALVGLGAIVIGGIHRTLLGVLIIAILDNGLNMLGIDAYTQMVTKGVVIVVAVLATRGPQAFGTIK